MVKRNRGVSITTDFFFDDMASLSVKIPFSDNTYCWSTYMLTHKDEEISPDIRLFQTHVMEWLKVIKSGKYPR